MKNYTIVYKTTCVSLGKEYHRINFRCRYHLDTLEKDGFVVRGYWLHKPLGHLNYTLIQNTYKIAKMKKYYVQKLVMSHLLSLITDPF